MELKFDKEMDAILRKARKGSGAAVAVAHHLDADAVAAFAENALPQKARSLFMEHFADCDQCRKQLSYTILTNTEAVASPTRESASNVIAEAVATAVPWYSKLFRTPNLAMAMAALVLTFGGVLGYLVLQNRSGEVNVSQVNDKGITNAPYSAASAPAANSANVAANSAAPANTAVIPSGISNSAATGTSAGRADVAGVSGPSPTDTGTSSGEGYSEAAKPVAAAPPVKTDQPESKSDEKNDADKAKETKDLAAAKQESEDRMARETVPPSAKKTGPNRASDQRNALDNNVAAQSVAGGMAAPSPVKTAGGKKFENRDGAWYDTAYRSQGTTNVRRGTDDYQKLDAGLRSIAQSISGTVVIVWKGKAYRIN